jgi:hypothetical protein
VASQRHLIGEAKTQVKDTVASIRRLRCGDNAKPL